MRPAIHDATARQNSGGPLSVIGQVIASWSNLEATLQQAIWTFLKLSDDDGRLVTGRMVLDHEDSVGVSTPFPHQFGTRFQDDTRIEG